MQTPEFASIPGSSSIATPNELKAEPPSDQFQAEPGIEDEGKLTANLSTLGYAMLIHSMMMQLQ